MKKNYLLIGGAALAVYYLFFKKKSNTQSTKALIPTQPQAAVIQPKPMVSYPAGTMEGDYVKFGTDETVYLLRKGQRLPISYEWWMANARDSWDTIKYVSAAEGLDIPKGNTL